MASMGKLRDALQALSGYYNSPELNSTQHADLVDLLDALSKEVIYSPRHLVESPYAVKATDTLESLSAKYQITSELFAAINGLGDSKALIDGSQVKVLPGPFRAVVSLSRQELTVFIGELYAGRFPVSFGKDPSPVEGTFEVVDRRRDRTYYGTGGKVIPAGDPRNPYGGYWLNLGQDLCIHGTPEMASDDLQGAGCISLAPLDAVDVYSILSQSSQVSIVR
jgi:lipoprotein-anchoring transpeptidase ErfK/SrfK